jgi:hypothetical protein
VLVLTVLVLATVGLAAGVALVAAPELEPPSSLQAVRSNRADRVKVKLFSTINFSSVKI